MESDSGARAAISGIEMRLADNEEIVVRGPNIFPDIGNAPPKRRKSCVTAGFTRRSGEVDAPELENCWRIKNLVILGSGTILRRADRGQSAGAFADASQVVLMGNARGYLSALITGKVSGEKRNRRSIW